MLEFVKCEYLKETACCHGVLVKMAVVIANFPPYRAREYERVGSIYYLVEGKLKAES